MYMAVPTISIETVSLDSLNPVANIVQSRCFPYIAIIFGCKFNAKMSLEHIYLFLQVYYSSGIKATARQPVWKIIVLR